jgi:hypothetical protein
MTVESDSKRLGEQRITQISSLRLDPENPRLPVDKQGVSQEDLAVDLDLGYEALTVADSIATHGFFNSEPLIVIPDATEPDTWIVVEGNRRLTALLGLSSKSIRSQFPDPETWEALAVRAGITSSTEVPVVVAPSRQSVVPIIGFRHISGILAWTPFAQARYVAKLVDDDRMPIAEVGKTVGIEKGRAGNLYREQAIAKQAADLGIETGPVESAFSLLTVAMSNTKLRDHISAPLGSKLKAGEPPIPPSKQSELKELLTWVFGSPDVAPLIADSREISRLGHVVGSSVGLDSIRKGDTLDQALQRIDDAGLDTHLRLTKRLTTARQALQAAQEDIAENVEHADVRELLDEIRDAYDALISALGE